MTGGSSQNSDAPSEENAEKNTESAAPVMTSAWMPVKISLNEPEDNNRFEFEISYDENGWVSGFVIMQMSEDHKGDHKNVVTYNNWDNSGRPLSGDIKSDNAEGTLSYTYNEDGLVKSYRFGMSQGSFTYEMDSDGKIVSISSPAVSIFGQYYEMHYDDNGSLFKVDYYRDWDENDRRYKETEIFGYEYDENGNIVKKKVYAYDRTREEISNVDEVEETEMYIHKIEYAETQVPEGTVDGYELARLVTRVALIGNGCNFWY